MNKTHFLLLAGLLLGACTDNRRVYETPSQIRDYQTDAEIMAQFVDVDRSTGLFYIDADKRINLTDYVVNHTREELESVSDINRDRFLREMNEANGIIKALRDAAHVSAIVYSTFSNDYVRQGSDNSYLTVNRFANEVSRSGFLAGIDTGSEKADVSIYRVPENVQMNVAASPRSMFYVSQLSFSDIAGTDRAAVIVSGVGTTIPRNYMLVFSDEADRSFMKIKGVSLSGDGNVSVSLSK